MSDILKHPWLRPLRGGLYVLLCLGVFLLIMEFVLPIFWPFIVGLVLSRFIHPAAAGLSRRARIPYKLAALLMSVLSLVLFAGLTAAVVALIISQVVPFAENIGLGYQTLTQKAGELWQNLSGLIDRLPVYLADAVHNAFARLPQSIDIASVVIRPITALASSLPNVLMSAAALVISTFFFAIDNARIADFVRSRVKPAFYKKLTRVKKHLIDTLFTWIKAQLLIMLITFAVLALGLTLQRTEYALLLAGIIAFVDMLPILGAGIIMVPWAIIALISGSYATAAAVGGMFIVVTLIREFVEPGVIGGQFGMHPLLTLVSAYAGFRVYGVFGMITLPLFVVTVIQFNRWGYVKIWQEEDGDGGVAIDTTKKPERT